MYLHSLKWNNIYNSAPRLHGTHFKCSAATEAAVWDNADVRHLHHQKVPWDWAGMEDTEPHPSPKAPPPSHQPGPETRLIPGEGPLRSSLKSPPLSSLLRNNYCWRELGVQMKLGVKWDRPWFPWLRDNLEGCRAPVAGPAAWVPLGLRAFDGAITSALGAFPITSSSPTVNTVPRPVGPAHLPRHPQVHAQACWPRRQGLWPLKHFWPLHRQAVPTS